MKKKFLDKYHTHWQWFRDFFSIAILKYFVVWFSVVPIAVNSFRAVPDTLSLRFSEGVITIAPELPFSWVLLWIASVFYTAALLIFAIRCPDFIKKYPTFNSYRDHGHSPRWIIWLAYDVKREGGKAWEKLQGKLHAKGYAIPYSELAQSVDESPRVNDDATSFVFQIGEERFRLAMPVMSVSGDSVDESATSLVEREIFWEVFGAQAGSRAFTRALIILLLMAAALLFLLVLLQHVLAAVPFAWDALGGIASSLNSRAVGLIDAVASFVSREP